MHTPTNTDALRIGPSVEIVRDVVNDAERIVAQPGIESEDQFFVTVKYHATRTDLNETLGSIVQHQMHVLGLTIAEAAHLASEDPDGFLHIIDGSPDITTDRLINAATSLGARVDVGNLDDPFAEFVSDHEVDVHE